MRRVLRRTVEGGVLVYIGDLCGGDWEIKKRSWEMGGKD